MSGQTESAVKQKNGLLNLTVKFTVLIARNGLRSLYTHINVSKRTNYTGCGRNNAHILKVNKNQKKQGTQKTLLFIKSTYDAIFFQTLLKITSLKCRPLLMTHS